IERDRGDFLALRNNRIDRVHHRMTRGHGAAGTYRGIAGDAEIRVAVTMHHFFGLDPELLGNDASKDGRMALPGRVYVQPEFKDVVLAKNKCRAFERHGARMFEKAGDADTAHLAAPPGFRAARG